MGLGIHVPVLLSSPIIGAPFDDHETTIATHSVERLLLLYVPLDAATAPPTTPPPAPTCTNGKVFHSCGTACPRTCDNHQQQFLPCTRQCVIGCFCPEGMVEMGDNCVPPSACPGTLFVQCIYIYYCNVHSAICNCMHLVYHRSWLLNPAYCMFIKCLVFPIC